MKSIKTLLVFAVLALASLVFVSPSNANDVNPRLPALDAMECISGPALDSALFPEVVVIQAVASHPLHLRSSYSVTNTGYHFVPFRTRFDSHRLQDRITPAYRFTYTTGSRIHRE